MTHPRSPPQRAHRRGLGVRRLDPLLADLAGCRRPSPPKRATARCCGRACNRCLRAELCYSRPFRTRDSVQTDNARDAVARRAVQADQRVQPACHGVLVSLISLRKRVRRFPSAGSAAGASCTWCSAPWPRRCGRPARPAPGLPPQPAPDAGVQRAAAGRFGGGATIGLQHRLPRAATRRGRGGPVAAHCSHLAIARPAGIPCLQDLLVLMHGRQRKETRHRGSRWSRHRAAGLAAWPGYTMLQRL